MSKVIYGLKRIISLPDTVGTFGGMYELKNLHSPTTQSNSDSSQEVSQILPLILIYYLWSMKIF